jgi:hypothetical protein
MHRFTRADSRAFTQFLGGNYLEILQQPEPVYPKRFYHDIITAWIQEGHTSTPCRTTIRYLLKCVHRILNDNRVNQERINEIEAELALLRNQNQ